MLCPDMVSQHKVSEEESQMEIYSPLGKCHVKLDQL